MIQNEYINPYSPVIHNNSIRTYKVLSIPIGVNDANSTFDCKVGIDLFNAAATFSVEVDIQVEFNASAKDITRCVIKKPGWYPSNISVVGVFDNYVFNLYVYIPAGYGGSRLGVKMLQSTTRFYYIKIEEAAIPVENPAGGIKRYGCTIDNPEFIFEYFQNDNNVITVLDLPHDSLKKHYSNHSEYNNNFITICYGAAIITAMLYFSDSIQNISEAKKITSEANKKLTGYEGFGFLTELVSGKKIPAYLLGGCIYISPIQQGQQITVEQGTYSLLINCRNTKQKEYSVLSLENATVTLDNSSFVYDGNNKEPNVTSVVLNDYELVRNNDYIVISSEESAIGTYNVIVEGKGKYIGSKSKSWKIE